MDTVFRLDESGRANFFRLIMQSIGYTYICLWSYVPLSNCLCFLDGFFNEENGQPSSSSGTRARRFFDEYRQTVFTVETDCVPGFAFKNSRPYIELQEPNLQRLATTEAQRQFYQEARIKTAIFMGCKSGEIEIGFSNVPQLDIEKEMRSYFHDDFSRQFSPLTESLPRPDQNPPSSSSSSLRSLSMDSPEYSSLLFNIPSTSHFPETLAEIPTLHQVPTTTTPHQQAMQAFARSRNIQFPAPESENAAMARAILAVLSSPSASSSSSHQQQQNLPYTHQMNSQAGAFKRYPSSIRPTSQLRTNVRRQSMLKRSIGFFRNLNFLRLQERVQASRPTSTQLHHMISERKRREKLNESFQALRSLLPPGTKKDKASLLTTTREYLSSLKAQIEELTRRNQLLEAQFLAANEEESSLPSERLTVRISHVSESTSEGQTVDLQVTIRGECPTVDTVIRILEFLKQIQNIGLMSMETTTRIVEATSINRMTFRLRIEGNEWDESAFQEAVRRVVADLAR